jgi:hypothetical protein
LEWPKITLKIKIPIPKRPENAEKAEEGQEILEENGRFYKLVDYQSQSEIDRVRLVHDFITKHTGIPVREQKLVATGTLKKGKPRISKNLEDPTKPLADFKVEENDIIELVPRQLKINLVSAGEKKQTTLDHVFWNDTVESIKDRIANGAGESDGIPPIPKTIVIVKKSKDGTELNQDDETLLAAGVKDGDELDFEKTK